MNNSYLKIADHYKQTFDKHGATPQGLDWDNEKNMMLRYRAMFDLIKPSMDDQTLLDFGCGYGGFYGWFNKTRKDIIYSGLDINGNLLKKAKELYPGVDFFQSDIHRNTFDCDLFDMSKWDYIICNGTFTVKNTLTQEEMTNFMCSTLEKLWTKTNKGIAFNCMSKILDYERDDLFHVSFDELSMWVYDNLSSKFTIRQDYGLREFTMYVYR